MSNQETNEFVPAMTLLNSTGDVTVSWDEKDEASVMALVEKKMAQGYAFFVLKPRRFGLPGSSKQKVKSLDAVRKAGHVVVPDELVQEMFKQQLGDKDLEAVVEAGKARVVSAGQGGNSTFESVRRAKTATEVVRNQTVAVRQVVGG